MIMIEDYLATALNGLKEYSFEFVELVYWKGGMESEYRNSHFDDKCLVNHWGTGF